MQRPSETFVCEGQYATGLARILHSYVQNLDKPEQPAVWVGGFFGSGKSHLVKMLRSLWVDFTFPDQATARGIAKLPTDITDLLRELSTAGRRCGGLHAAAGTLSAGAGDSVRLALLGIVFRSAGLPEKYPIARFVMWLKRQGIYDRVRQEVEAAGKPFDKELLELYVSPVIARALLTAEPTFAANAAEARALLRTQYPNVNDISLQEMVDALGDAISVQEQCPCTLVVLDEVQQYIGDNADRTLNVQEVTEACVKKFGGRLLFVGTGQSALSSTPQLQKLQGRFRLAVQLSDTDVETVIRQVILAKKPDKVPPIQDLLTASSGEISRHLVGTRIEPRAEDRVDLFTAGFAELQPLLEKALQSDRASMNADLAAAGVAAQGIAHAAELLTGRYHLVMTNVPYLARGKQGKVLRDFCEQHYSDAKPDLATVFVERCLSLCASGGSAALVTPQNWLFLTSYKNLRQRLLREQTWNMVARLGEGGFDSPQAAGAFTVLLFLTQHPPCEDQEIHGIEASAPRTAAAKAAELMIAVVKSVEQAKQLGNPDARVALEESGEHELLAKYADGLNGMHGADSLRFRFNFWEVTDFDTWHFFQCTHSATEHFGGKEYVFYWANNGQIHRDNPRAYVKGANVWGKPGVVVSMMRDLPVTLYSGNKFDISCTPVVPHNPSHLPAIWCFCSSPEYNDAVRQIDQSLKVTNATLVKVPFDLDHWTRVAQEKYPNGLPKPYSDDPTQWIFHGHPAQSDAPLQVAVARLLSYRWPAEQDSGMELSDDARAWVKKSETLLTYADGDGIVCIPAVRGEKPAADRLRELLATAYGQAWSPATQEELLAAVGFSGKTLENWLRDGFFDQHCKLFHQRPFIWHIWDGRRDGFSALVNYHTLDRRQLEKLTYTYLGDWIKRQEDSRARDEGGAEARLLAAHELQHRLKRILEGQPPYDIFVRWKPLEQQPIGWEPDVNDGVRLNIRPFVHADVLRKRPGITWGKDRGKNPPGSPWGEERLNDRHITLEEKWAVQQHVR